MSRSEIVCTVIGGAFAFAVIVATVRCAHSEDLVAVHQLPDPQLTPGLADPVLTKDVICNPHWSTKIVRHVTTATKKQVLASYHVTNHKAYCGGKEGCEIDHLISLELGGSNDAKNLWPQPYTGEFNAHFKDRLENRLHDLVCSGKITLDFAQFSISSDWITAYKTFIKPR